MAGVLPEPAALLVGAALVFRLAAPPGVIGALVRNRFPGPGPARFVSAPKRRTGPALVMTPIRCGSGTMLVGAPEAKFWNPSPAQTISRARLPRSRKMLLSNHE